LRELVGFGEIESDRPIYSKQNKVKAHSEIWGQIWAGKWNKTQYVLGIWANYRTKNSGAIDIFICLQCL